MKSIGLPLLICLFVGFTKPAGVERVAYCHERMMAVKNEALALLEDIPDSPSKQLLIGLVEYTVNREK